MAPYLSIARPDHWFKNLFMVIGFMAALTYNVKAPEQAIFIQFAWGLLATCLMASFNYVTNEILDAPHDAKHPVKCNRPVPSGKVSIPLAWLWAVVLAAASFALAIWKLNTPFTICLGIFLLSGIFYNVRPLRLKDRPFLDVICESFNNPIRLMLGWYCLWPHPDPWIDRYKSVYLDDLMTQFGVTLEQAHWLLPPSSIVLGFWAIGGFMMTTKRFAELRSFSTQAEAAAYRPCFKSYSEENLSVAMAVYVTSFAFCFGIMTMKYQERLVWFVPFLIIFIGWFYHLAYQRDSIVKTPERLVERPGFLGYCLILLLLLTALLFQEQFDW